MADSDSFSDSVDKLLHLLRPHGRKQTCYPPSLDQNASRFETGESIHQWFARMVKAFCDDDPDRYAIEGNVALFAFLAWKKKQLFGANIAALITSCDLCQYLLEPPPECDVMYLRLDYDYGTLGEPFSHPLPHIHVHGGLSPRFALDGGNSENVVMDFLESVYRQFVPSKWKSWAQREWDRNYFTAQQDPERNPFPLIMAAFKESQVGVLREHRQHINRLKQLLRMKKDQLFEFGMDGSDRELLEYPAAR
jgi:hypothetical protein